LVMVVAPFVVGAAAAAAVPFIPAPVEEEDVGKARSDVWSAWDMGKESEDGETKALA
jgi:hypothetical protein